MSFALIVILSLVALGAIAALFSIGGEDEPIVHAEGDCASCASHADGSCKIACLMDEAKKRKGKKDKEEEDEEEEEEDEEEEDEESESSPTRPPTARKAGIPHALLLFAALSLFAGACSTQKNTSQSRQWHAFNTRYNTYFNASQAFIEGSDEKLRGHHDDCTQLLPLYPVATKQSRTVGSAQFDRAIEKSEKAIRRHSIKQRPEWNKQRRKTPQDVEWLSRREYNPFLWHAWLLLGKSQFQKGEFEEAAATFSYMSRLYATQPVILARARAWLAKSYTEMDWLYEADDIIAKQRRDSIPYQARADWQYTLADYYIHTGQWAEALTALRSAIKHERQRRQRARMWYLAGQIETLLQHPGQAYEAYRHVIRLNPPYELEFQARIAQTEVLSTALENQSPAAAKKLTARLQRMAANDNNSDYLDQLYYAIGNIHLARHDTLSAIAAYEQGHHKATRSGTEHGVLLLQLGNLYWQREQYVDAHRCYSQAIGMLDTDRRDYRQLASRSEVLDALAPHLEAIHLQDSLQRLASLPEAERNKAIDRVIETLRRKEREERRAQQETEAQQHTGDNNTLDAGSRMQPSMPAANRQRTDGSSTWYFYNPLAVSQGKQQFQQQWGQRENVDNWQRANRTVVALGSNAETSEAGHTASDGLTSATDSLSTSHESGDTTSLDPHTREYYLAQLPFTTEQRQQSDAIIMPALLQAAIITKDRIDNLPYAERLLRRLTDSYPQYEHTDGVLYHLYLLLMRQQRQTEAEAVLARMQQSMPDSEWTRLLSDPYFADNQRFGIHLEDSLYAATYDAFRNERYEEVMANAALSAQRFPNGQHRPQFVFIRALSLLNEGQPDSCMQQLQQVVEQHADSEVSQLAGHILRGIQQGRQLQGSRLTADDIWSHTSADRQPSADSIATDTLSLQTDVRYALVLAYLPDSLDRALPPDHPATTGENQLLFELARYNFTAYLVRNFELAISADGALHRMTVAGFRNLDEARQYHRQLFRATTADNAASPTLAALLGGCRVIIISEENLPLLGTAYSYDDYEQFFSTELAPTKPSPLPLLTQPETIVEQPSTDDDTSNEASDSDDDDLPPVQPATQQQTTIDFDDDFYY